MTQDESRQKFEEWLLQDVAEHCKQDLIRRLESGPNYWYPHVNLAWKAWNDALTLNEAKEAKG